jgi:hypothetical protein
MNDKYRKDSEYYAGMTVNERLFDASLIDSFEVAARARDRTKIISLLQKVFVENPEFTADTILENPTKYGY